VPMISDEDAALLAAVQRIGGATGLDLAVRAKALHDSLYSDPELSLGYQQTISKKFPTANTIERVAAPFVAKIDATQKQLDDFLAAQKKEREDAEQARLQGDFNTSWAQVVKDYSLTAEGEEKLESLMKDRKIADPEAAAALYFKLNPAPAAPVAPSSVAPQGWAKDMGLRMDADDSDSKLLVGDPDAWADKEAAAILTEVRREAA
jgi:hypothetical protein